MPNLNKELLEDTFINSALTFELVNNLKKTQLTLENYGKNYRSLHLKARKIQKKEFKINKKIEKLEKEKKYLEREEETKKVIDKVSKENYKNYFNYAYKKENLRKYKKGISTLRRKPKIYKY